MGTRFGKQAMTVLQRLWQRIKSVSMVLSRLQLGNKVGNSKYIKKLNESQRGNVKFQCRNRSIVV